MEKKGQHIFARTRYSLFKKTPRIPNFFSFEKNHSTGREAASFGRVNFRGRVFLSFSLFRFLVFAGKWASEHSFSYVRKDFLFLLFLWELKGFTPKN